MSAKFIHMSSRSLERTMAAIMVYWIALGVAALILALAVRQGATPERGVRPPYLAVTAAGALAPAASRLDFVAPGRRVFRLKGAA